jgi:hypothetical protein
MRGTSEAALGRLRLDSHSFVSTEENAEESLEPSQDGNDHQEDEGYRHRDRTAGRETRRLFRGHNAHPTT